jgi:hypothetical protein
MNTDTQTQKEIDEEIAALAVDAIDSLSKSKAPLEPNIKDRCKEEMQYGPVRQVWHSILEDYWMYVVVWSEPRLGKSTCKMKLAYTVYHDWDLVLDSVVFNLAGLLYKMTNKQPMQIWTKDHLHFRIPFLIGDDWGANCNKAKTQHEPAWDLVKGMWDTLGTSITSVWVSMNQPSEITAQLAAKYTHELFVESRGHAKFDKVNWQQNFNGWQPFQKKDWTQSFDFGPVPSDIYRRYDEARCSLVDELVITIQDKIAETDLDRTMKRMVPNDYALLEQIRQYGVLSQDKARRLVEAGTFDSDAVKRCKSRNLIIASGTDPIDHRCKYDISDLGLEILKISQLQEVDPKQLKKELKEVD